MKKSRPRLHQDDDKKLQLAFKLYDEHYTIAHITEVTGITKPTFYRRLKERDERQQVEANKKLF
ncbi:helix-turn-helix domain-containing protein [Paenibacillus lignilyticus]|uniref:Helix-turn-helix domain-containing protein n=1 Tax=Paenibacillus lignilyticus TaxID=1172615 RepID=A0ABS5CND4_9BACL|nr:helix-turn-helix domain-containing protein [Paenibacillus lignilyticus]